MKQAASTQALDAENCSVCTYRGAADAWECDQMQHMNVKFIAERLSRADMFFRSTQSVFARQVNIRVEAEKISFRREIKPGRPFLIRTRLERKCTNTSIVVHELVFADNGDVSAQGIVCLRNGAPVGSHPTAETSESGEPIAAIEQLVRPDVGLKESGRSVVGPEDHSGADIRREALVRLINHGASVAGLDRGRQWSDDGRLRVGSAMLEVAIRRRSPLPIGAPLIIRSGLKARSDKVLTVFHHLLEADGSTVAIEAASTHLFFDLASRRAIQIPTKVQQLAASQGPPDLDEVPHPLVPATIRGNEDDNSPVLS
jgi:acyl-CoA thioester hydrolase